MIGYQTFFVCGTFRVSSYPSIIFTNSSILISTFWFFLLAYGSLIDAIKCSLPFALFCLFSVSNELKAKSSFFNSIHQFARNATNLLIKGWLSTRSFFLFLSDRVKRSFYFFYSSFLPDFPKYKTFTIGTFCIVLVGLSLLALKFSLWGITSFAFFYFSGLCYPISFFERLDKVMSAIHYDTKALIKIYYEMHKLVWAVMALQVLSLHFSFYFNGSILYSIAQAIVLIICSLLYIVRFAN